MRNAALSVATALCLVMNATGALASPCSKQAITGTWMLAGITADEPGVEDFYARAPHEAMRFAADGAMIYVASNTPIPAEEVQARLDGADLQPGTDFTFETDSNGSLLLRRAGQPFQTFRCAIADAATADTNAGDMILTNVVGAPALRRVQRRVR